MLFLTFDLRKGIHALILFRPRSFNQVDCYLASEKKIEPDHKLIDLVMIFVAILTSRQTREKLQCLYENLMSNNFRITAFLKEI